MKISWEQVLIQNKGRETRKDFSTKKISQKGKHLLEILLESILEIFWIREPGFDPELCLPETPLFHLLFYFPPYCALSVSIVRVFTVVNSPSTIRFVVVWWRACPKGLFGRRRSATTSTRKSSKVFFLERSISTTCDVNFLPKRLWSSFWSKSVFSFKIFFAFLGSFIKVFNICKRRLCKIEFDAWPRRSTVCSVNLMWSSTGTGAVSSGAFVISSNRFHNLERGPEHLKFSLGIFPLLHPGLELVRSAP